MLQVSQQLCSRLPFQFTPPLYSLPLSSLSLWSSPPANPSLQTLYLWPTLFLCLWPTYMEHPPGFVQVRENLKSQGLFKTGFQHLKSQGKLNLCQWSGKNEILVQKFKERQNGKGRENLKKNPSKQVTVGQSYFVYQKSFLWKKKNETNLVFGHKTETLPSLWFIY